LIKTIQITGWLFALLLGMMLHNFWRVFHVKQLVVFLRSKGMPVELFQEAQTWIRKPPDKGANGLIDAVSFLTRIIGIGIVSLVQERMKCGK